MGIFSRRTIDFVAAASAVPETSYLNVPAGVLSPSVPLASVLFPDLDLSEYPVTVGEAMAVPAVARAIALYSSISSRFVLDSSDNSTPWLQQGYGFVTPQLRIALTIQDLIFHNCSLWQVEKDGLGVITEAQHVARNRWTIENGGIVKIDQKTVNANNVIYFQGLMPGGGFLESGRHSVRQYTSIAATINNRAAVAEPVTLVKETQDSGASPDEINAAMDGLESSLNSRRGGQVFVPYGIDIVGYGASDNANSMMTAARNAIRLDLSNHLNIKAELLEGASDGSSDTYSSTLQNAAELLELSIKTFTEPIANRLSLDDVTAPGTVVTFDYSSFDPVPVTNTTPKGAIPTSTNEVTE